MGSFRGITFVQTTASMEIITSTASPKGLHKSHVVSDKVCKSGTADTDHQKKPILCISYPLTPFQPSFCVQSDQALVPVSDTVCRKGESQ